MAAEVKDFQPESYFDRKEAKRMARYTSWEWLRQSRLLRIAKYRAWLTGKIWYLYGSIGGIEYLKRIKNCSKRTDRISVFIPMMIPNMLSGQIAIKIRKGYMQLYCGSMCNRHIPLRCL